MTDQNYATQFGNPFCHTGALGSSCKMLLQGKGESSPSTPRPHHHFLTLNQALRRASGNSGKSTNCSQVFFLFVSPKVLGLTNVTFKREKEAACKQTQNILDKICRKGNSLEQKENPARLEKMNLKNQGKEGGLWMQTGRGPALPFPVACQKGRESPQKRHLCTVSLGRPGRKHLPPTLCMPSMAKRWQKAARLVG